MMYVLLFSLCTNLLLLAPSVYSLQVLDRVISSASIPTLIYLTLIIVAALVFYGMFCLIRSAILSRVGEWLDTQVSERLLGMGITQNAAGEPTQASRHLRDVQTIKGFITGTGITSLFDAPWSIIYLLVIYMINPLLGFVTLIGGLILLALAIMNELFTRKPYAMASRIQAKTMEIADAASRSAEAVEAMGMMGDIGERWNLENRRAQELLLKAGGRANLIQHISRVLRMLLQIAITGIGGYLAIRHEITGGAMIASSILSGKALGPFETAIGIWKSLLSARESYRKLEKAISHFPYARGNVELPAPVGQVVLENLVYAPQGQKVIIRGVSFVLNPGEMLGIIGASAAGKSTLAKLIIGILPPSSGTVRLDGAEIFKWNRELVGPHVGYLPQQVDFFDGTVLENIARMQANPDHHKVIEAAKMAGVHDMILRLPEGYETQIRPGNHTLSPGQRQRIGLARALYANPKLIVLDEPNASLDGEGEQALLQALSAIRANGITCIVVAHRPSLVQHTDKILLLQQGTVQEFGETKKILGKFLTPKTSHAMGNA